MIWGKDICRTQTERGGAVMLLQTTGRTARAIKPREEVQNVIPLLKHVVVQVITGKLA